MEGDLFSRGIERKKDEVNGKSGPKGRRSENIVGRARICLKKGIESICTVFQRNSLATNETCFLGRSAFREFQLSSSAHQRWRHRRMFKGEEVGFVWKKATHAVQEIAHGVLEA